MSIPEIIFIIPYRNREEHKEFFLYYMKKVLKNVDFKYEIYFSHQCDKREFNRGGTKNVAFVYIKNKYPNDYKNITLVFHDIDTMPFKEGIISYPTYSNNVKHFYGFKFALGGIISITGEDFEKINGFPNFFGWGCEDNVLQDRCNKNNLTIDRSNFFEIGDHNILHIFDSYIKKYDPASVSRCLKKKDNDGIDTLYNINYKCEEFDDHFIINIFSFDGLYKELPSNLKEHDLRTGNQLHSKISHNRSRFKKMFLM